MSSEKRNEGSSCSTSTSGGDSNPCPICLAAIPHLQDSYLDRCFHKFCYKCIVQWSKVAAYKLSDPPTSVKCPLCKSENFAIIYGYDGNSFERHYIQQIHTDGIFISEEHRYRLRCYYMEPGILGNLFNVHRFWKSQKFRQSNEWIKAWLTREIQALMQEEDVDIIMHHILGTANTFLQRDAPRVRKQPQAIQEEFKEVVSSAARPFLGGRTDRFVSEMELFLASGLTLKAYDEVYLQQIGQSQMTDGRNNDPAEEQRDISTEGPDLFLLDENGDGIE